MKGKALINVLNQLPLKTASTLEICIRNKVNNGQRSGRHYKGQPTRSSAPGEPPAKQTRNLIDEKNLRTKNVGVHKYMVYMTAEYAPHLEFGTKKMAPRPFIRPSILETIETIKKLGKIKK